MYLRSEYIAFSLNKLIDKMHIHTHRVQTIDDLTRCKKKFINQPVVVTYEKAELCFFLNEKFFNIIW